MQGKLIALAMVALLLGGCASKKTYPYNPKDSFALNTMRAAGAKVIKDNKLPPGDTMLVDVALQGTLGAAGSLATVANISSGLAGGLWALDGLFSSKKDMESFPLIFGWEAKGGLTEEQVLEKSTERLRAAFAAAREMTVWPEVFETGEIETKPSGWSSFELNGGLCSGDFFCRYQICRPWLKNNLRLKMRTPECFTGKERVAVLAGVMGRTIWERNPKIFTHLISPAVLPDVDFFVEMSKQLSLLQKVLS
ncbi:hypothetical protein [Desulfuromonas thiophila]|uniref:hypothetical protein n=1 Tax=Desulfuromonas thiophila TaxID=57664 RepID=UPI0029F5850B|nr:hypothetical protein [Desulfuromonas thiophila]